MLPQIARNPALIAKGNSPGTVILVSEIKNPEGENIIVPIKLNVQGNRTIVNRVSSIYGKKNISNYLQSLENSNGILAINKEKAVRLYEDTGSQFPQSLTAIRFDNSIAYSTQNVKGSLETTKRSKSLKTEKEATSRNVDKKTFTFPRRKLNENTRNIKEQATTQKNLNKSKNKNQNNEL